MENSRSFCSPECARKAGNASELTSSDVSKQETRQNRLLNTSESSNNTELVFSKSYEAKQQEILLWLAEEKENDQKLQKKIINDMVQTNDRIEKIDKIIFEVLNSQKISKHENSKVLEYLKLDTQEAIEKLKSLLPRVVCDHRLSSNAEINKDIESMVESKVENLTNKKIMELKFQMKDQDSKLNLEWIRINEQLEKIAPIIDEKEKLHQEILNDKNEFENMLLQARENKIMSDMLIKEKLEKKKDQILCMIEKFDNYLRDYPSSLENLHKIKKMKLRLLKKFNIKRLTVQPNTIYYVWFEDYSKIYNEIFERIDRFIEEYAAEDKYIYGLTRNNGSTNLYFHEIETHNTSQTRIFTPLPLNSYTCIAKLPTNKLFCYGSNDPISGVAYIIDPVKKVLTESLPEGTPVNFAGAIYHDNSIYVFGGHNGSAVMTLARKFNLLESTWIDLAALPVASQFCSCVLFKESILLSGKDHSILYKYLSKTNNYEAMFSALTKGNNKILIRSNHRIYILQSDGNSYECEKNNERIWNKISTGSFTTSYYNSLIIYSKGSLIINLQDNSNMHCYKFSLKDKKIQELSIN